MLEELCWYAVIWYHDSILPLLLAHPIVEKAPWPLLLAKDTCQGLGGENCPGPRDGAYTSHLKSPPLSLLPFQLLNIKLYLPAKNHSNLSLNNNSWCSELWRTCLQAFQNVRELFTTSNKTISHDLCIRLHSLAAQNGLISELRVAERWELKKPRISSGRSGSSFLRVYTWKSQEVQMT